MKCLKIYFIFISSFCTFDISGNCLANEIEKQFIEADLVNVSDIDISIKVDLVNSDPEFLPLRHGWWHFNGMRKDEARKKYQIIE